MELPNNIQAASDFMTVVQAKKASALKSSKQHKPGQVGSVVAVEGKHAGGIATKMEIQVSRDAVPGVMPLQQSMRGRS